MKWTLLLACASILVLTYVSTSDAAIDGRHRLTIHGASGFEPQDAPGKAAYDENCKKCHGVVGRPPKTMKEKYPKLATFDAEFLTKYSEGEIVEVLLKGGKTEDMKSFKGKLSADEIRDVAKYVRELAAKVH